MPIVPTDGEREQENDNGAVGMNDLILIRDLSTILKRSSEWR